MSLNVVVFLGVCYFGGRNLLFVSDYKVLSYKISQVRKVNVELFVFCIFPPHINS
jgi:hypothetical protein